MKFQRTSVGLDVHARSVVGCGLERNYYARSVDPRSTPTRKSRPAVPNPRISDLTRVDTTRSTPFAASSGQRSGGHDDGCGRRFTLPT